MPIQANKTSICVGTCCCHPPIPCIPMTGYLLTSSSDVLCGPSGAGRMTDLVIGYCGHTGIIITGSSGVTMNGLPAARQFDTFSGCFSGTIITGFPTILTG